MKPVHRQDRDRLIGQPTGQRLDQRGFPRPRRTGDGKHLPSRPRQQCARHLKQPIGIDPLSHQISLPVLHGCAEIVSGRLRRPHASFGARSVDRKPCFIRARRA